MTLEATRDLCLSFPAVTEGIKWENNLCFMIGEKLFCLTNDNDGYSVSFKCNEEDFNILTEKDQITQAPYFARNQWVTVCSPSALNKNEWEEYLKKSYQLILEKLPKKLKKELGFL